MTSSDGVCGDAAAPTPTYMAGQTWDLIDGVAPALRDCFPRRGGSLAWRHSVHGYGRPWLERKRRARARVYNRCAYTPSLQQ